MHFAGLDGYRAVAALMVVLTHVAFSTGVVVTQGTWGHLLGRLDFGVPLFFLMSGFLVYRPWVRRAFDGTTRPSLRRYAIRRAARLADGIFANAPAEKFVEQVGWMLDECERIGRDPSSFRFVHYSILLPGPSREEALARYRDPLWAMQWKYSDMEASATRSLPPPAAPAFDRPMDALVQGRATFAGPPGALVEALLDIRRQAGVPVEFVARSHLPLLEYHAQVDLMGRLAEGVAPYV